MKLEIYNSYWPWLVPFFLVFGILLARKRQAFFRFIQLHWFYSPSVWTKLSGGFLFLSLLFLFLALMDLRKIGEEIKVKGRQPVTYILLDASLGMLAEDVRPNRYQKAIFMAKHFVKRASGHLIGLYVFSDELSQISPPTFDQDYLLAKLEALSEIDPNSRGGTSLRKSLKELILEMEFLETPGANIVVYTDGEELGDNFFEKGAKFSNKIYFNLIGTEKGSTIPLRNRRGTLSGNKKFHGETVITKATDKYVKGLKDSFPSLAYDFVSSYSLNTQKIKNFFSSSIKEGKKSKENKKRITYPYAPYFGCAFFACLILSYCFSFFPTFTINHPQID